MATALQTTRARIQQATAGIATIKADKAAADTPSSEKPAADAHTAETTSPAKTPRSATAEPAADQEDSPPPEMNDRQHDESAAWNKPAAIAEEDEYCDD